MPSIELIIGVCLVYVVLLFLVAFYAENKRKLNKSIISNPYIYSLSIAGFVTTMTFYGSVGKTASSGIQSIYILIGPSLITCLWWMILRKIVRISKDNNITSIADFISLRYGKSLWLGALVTIIAILGIMPYIALQIKAISTSFYLISGFQGGTTRILHGGLEQIVPSGLLLAVILSVFSVIFGARRLVSSERHEGLVAAVAFDSVVKLVSLLGAGIFVTYKLYNGFGDIFTRFQALYPEKYTQLFTLDVASSDPFYIPSFTMLLLSMGAIMLLPRQFHVMVIENSDEDHINKAMWMFPVYLFLINLFVIPIALGGILSTGSSAGADFFAISVPLLSGYPSIALLVFIGGLSAASGMVIVESVTISTMLLNHLCMPVIVHFPPKAWFSYLLINLKRFGIFLVIFLGYFYYRMVGDTFMLVNMGLVSFSAVIQFLPSMLGGLYWRRGNKAGAITGILLGFLTWFYTLLIPSFIHSGWIGTDLLSSGPFGIKLLRPTELFGMAGMDLWSHSLFWSMFFNIGAYLACSIFCIQNEKEKEIASKFVGVFEHYKSASQLETKRLSKPVTINQFVSLLTKFIGETEAQRAIESYRGNREFDTDGNVSEFELPKLKRFTEINLAGSVGAAAAGAIVDSFLSDMGSRMESVYDIFSIVRASLDQSRESLFVRLKASEIINRSLDLQIIMDDLLSLLLKEFKLDATIIQLRDERGSCSVKSYSGSNRRPISDQHWFMESLAYCDFALTDRRAHIINDTKLISSATLDRTIAEGIVSCAYIPIMREGEPPFGVLSLFSKSISGLFTEEFIGLLSSLTGQLAQAIKLDEERAIREHDKKRREKADIARKVQEEYLQKKQYAEFSIVRHLTHNLKPKILIAKSPINNVSNFLVKRHLCDEVLSQRLDGSDETIQEALNTSISSLNQMASVLDSARKVVVSEIKPEDFELLEICSLFQNDILPLWNNNSFKINLISSKILVNIHRNSFVEAMNNIIRNAEVHGFKEMVKTGVLEFVISDDEYHIIIDYTNNGLPFPENMDANDFLSFGKKSVESPGEGLGGAWVAKAIDAHHGMFQVIRDDHPVHFRIFLPKEKM